MRKINRLMVTAGIIGDDPGGFTGGSLTSSPLDR
jgi:hypothetical protein